MKSVNYVSTKKLNPFPFLYLDHLWIISLQLHRGPKVHKIAFSVSTCSLTAGSH